MLDNPLTWVYFPSAVMLGALHALEPGHAKTLTAAYLIGIKGTKRDALLLGLSVATTHSFVVVALSALALWIGQESFTQDVTRWLQIGSACIVIILGIWMLLRRLRKMRRIHHSHHHDAPKPIHIKCDLCSGSLSIVATPDGERMQFATSQETDAIKLLRVIINRPELPEILELRKTGPGLYTSLFAPNEPHSFSAELELTGPRGNRELVLFEMHEPHHHTHEHIHSYDHHHEHDHSELSDDDHARAHAAAMPEYAKKGERPTLLQIITFGAAGGMIPCPASITVMLLALSLGKFGFGLLAVTGFSLGLAITLVGIGLIVVAGLSQLSSTGRFHWISAKAPVISASIVILSGCAALIFVQW